MAKRSEETVTEVTELEVIRLSDEDMRMGIHFEMEAARAQARLQAMFDAAQNFKEQMHIKYGADPKVFQILDWVDGFQPLKKE